MTASLACFLKELLKAKNHHSGDSSCSLVEILIVEDNAQLTPESRIKNIRSFATIATVGDGCHQASRWCSQPCLVTSIMNHQSYVSRSSRRRSSIGTNTDESTTSQKRNQSWKVLDVMMDDHGRSSKFGGMQSDDMQSCNPPMSMNCQTHKLLGPSESVLDAPARVPQRWTSPGSLQSRVLEKRKLSNRVRKSLRSALGDMAPKSSSSSSLVVEKRSCVGRTEYAPSSRRMVRTTIPVLSMDQKEVGSQRQRTTTRI